MRKYYYIIEIATGMTWCVSDNLKEIKNIYNKMFDKEYYVIMDNLGKEIEK